LPAATIYSQRVKLFFQNPTLSIAIAASVLVHGALLTVRFVSPDSFRFKPTDPGLEVILVNAKHDKKPVKAQALAQANLDGGGNANDGRAKSPLPDMRKSADGDSVKATQRRLAELEELQRKMLSQVARSTPFSAAPVTEKEKPREAPPSPNGMDKLDSAKELARMEAEIAKNIEDYNKRPKKTYISPSTREVGYAMYFDTVRKRIEKIGTLNFPQKDGKKLYGELILSISIYQDGSLYKADGDNGVAIDRSSGIPALDTAAKNIVRRSAPFGMFAKSMRSSDKNDVWVMTTSFKFTRDNELEATLRGGGN
jgi:protein TonB